MNVPTRALTLVSLPLVALTSFTAVALSLSPSLVNMLPQGGEPPPPSDQKAGNNQTDPPRDDPEGGDPVILFTGNLNHQETDLTVAGRGLDFTLSRTYRNGANFATALGAAWDFNWNQKILLEFETGYIPPWPGPSNRSGPGGGGSEVNQAAVGGGGGGVIVPVIGAYYFDGGLRIDKFEPVNEEEWQSPAGYFAKLRSYGASPQMSVNPPDYFDLRLANGTIYTFSVVTDRDPYHGGLTYLLSAVRDRWGNSISVLYDPHVIGAKKYYSIHSVLDAYGREILFTYDAAGKNLQSITDFTGRSVVFTRDGQRNLISVRSPTVSASPPHIAYPSGKTTRYNYGPGTHDLISIIDPQQYQNGAGSQIPYLQNTYSGGRIVKQIFGHQGGGSSPPVPAGGTWDTCSTSGHLAGMRGGFSMTGTTAW